jgi:guanylate kinase
MNGSLFMFIGPSGVGKTTVAEKVMEQVRTAQRVVTHTTRMRRPGEVDGVDYHFIPRPMFEMMIEDGKFVEYNEHHGNLYGTSLKAINSKLDAGADVLLVIDYVGAKNVLRMYSDTVSFFIAPPDRETLVTRLRDRGDDEESIQTRLSRMDEEMNEAKNFDYVIVNDNLNEAMSQVMDVIKKVCRL